MFPRLPLSSEHPPFPEMPLLSFRARLDPRSHVNVAAPITVGQAAVSAHSTSLLFDFPSFSNFDPTEIQRREVRRLSFFSTQCLSAMLSLWHHSLRPNALRSTLMMTMMMYSCWISTKRRPVSRFQDLDGRRRRSPCSLRSAFVLALLVIIRYPLRQRSKSILCLFTA